MHSLIMTLQINWSFPVLHGCLLLRYISVPKNQSFLDKGDWLAVATPPADSGIMSFSSLVTWSVSWSSAHPPDPLLFTNPHTVRYSRMRTSAWSDQVPEPHCTSRRVRDDPLWPYPHLFYPVCSCACLCVYVCITSWSHVLQQLWVGSRNRPVDRFGYNLLTAKLTSY